MIMKKEKMDRILAKLPPEDPDTDEWIRDVCVIPAFIIYNTKEGTGICTRCGSTNLGSADYTGRHGERDRCPECEAEVEILSEGRGRQGRSDYFRLLTWTRKGKTVYGRLWEIEASFKKVGPPELHKWLSALYIVNAKEQSYYKHKPQSWSEAYWEKYKTFSIPAPPGGTGYCWTTKYTFTYMRTVGLWDVFRKSDLKYLWIPGWCENMPPEEMVRYIGYGMRQQSIELMTKAGFTNLVMERLKGAKNGIVVNWQGKSLERILRQPKRNVRKLLQLNPTTRELQVFQKLTEEEQDIISPDMIRAMSGWIGCGSVEKFRERIEELAPFKKWLKYMNGQITEQAGIVEWIDYIEACKKMGRDIHRNRAIFPEHLKEAHDQAIAERVAKDDADRTAAIRAAARAEEFEDGSMAVLPGDTQEKLNIESAVLHHCVRTYGDKIARGKCWIWFVRKADDRNTPFYTLETDTEGNMRQCRGLHNRNMTEDVQRFVEKFTNHLQKEIRKERATA